MVVVVESRNEGYLASSNGLSLGLGNDLQLLLARLLDYESCSLGFLLSNLLALNGLRVLFAETKMNLLQPAAAAAAAVATVATVAVLRCQ
jgi:hypothetical protein